MSEQHYDSIIIGSGPAGEGAAMKLAKSGQKVAIVERHQQVGGGCTHWGTIPSKTLRHGIQMLVDYKRNPLYQHTIEQVKIDYPQLLQAAESVIQNQVGTRYRYYDRNNIDIIYGEAQFQDAQTLIVNSEVLRSERLTADHIIIATGSSPYHTPQLDFSHPRIHDSDSILSLKHTPSSLTIYGAGVIGCEYASIFCNLDAKVNLVNTRQALLSFLDSEITDALSYHLRNQGVVIRNNETLNRVEASDDRVTLHCESGKQFKTEILLWANGRTGNTNSLKLEAIGLKANSRGQIPVDENYRTAVPHIYAVGDVVGAPGLASASYDQGRYVGTLIAEEDCHWSLIKDFPTGIYTNPEISSLGRNEQELTEAQVPYEVGHAMFKSIARAQITGHTVGMLKLLFHRETLQILGIHCFGETAAEIIHIGQAIMNQSGEANSLRYFAETTFNYPTMAEAYRVAALNGLNRIE
ncbi:MAG: Si-specific NAD(P)(+) transhydrogenase [Gammaproteobacteria bacterium]|nr:Si-specific NAD(P)(+) transhydrogenase [Gammaproteobacteria bacterium]